MQLRPLVKNKKGFFGQLQPAVLVLGVVVIVVAMVLMILGEVKKNVEINSSEEQAIQKGIEAIGKIPQWLPILVIILVAIIILGALGAFGGGGGRRRRRRR